MASSQWRRISAVWYDAFCSGVDFPDGIGGNTFYGNVLAGRLWAAVDAVKQLKDAGFLSDGEAGIIAEGLRRLNIADIPYGRGDYGRLMRNAISCTFGQKSYDKIALPQLCEMVREIVESGKSRREVLVKIVLVIEARIQHELWELDHQRQVFPDMQEEHDKSAKFIDGLSSDLAALKSRLSEKSPKLEDHPDWKRVSMVFDQTLAMAMTGTGTFQQRYDLYQSLKLASQSAEMLVAQGKINAAERQGMMSVMNLLVLMATRNHPSEANDNDYFSSTSREYCCGMLVDSAWHIKNYLGKTWIHNPMTPRVENIENEVVRKTVNAAIGKLLQMLDMPEFYAGDLFKPTPTVLAAAKKQLQDIIDARRKVPAVKSLPASQPTDSATSKVAE